MLIKSKIPEQTLTHTAEDKIKLPVQTVIPKAEDKIKAPLPPIMQKVNHKAQPSGQNVLPKVQDKAIGSLPTSPYIEENHIPVPALSASIPLSLERQLDNIELTEYKLQFDVYNELVMQLQEVSVTLVQKDEQIKLIGLMNDIEDEIIKINSSSH